MQIKNFVGVSNNVKTIIKMSAIVVALAYFIFHAVSGDNGLLSYLRTKKLVLQQEQEFTKLLDDYESIVRNVNLLSDKALDKDLLEERCRIILNYSLPGDSVIRIKTVLKD